MNDLMRHALACIQMMWGNAMVPPDDELERLRAAVDDDLSAHEAYVAYLLAIAQFQEACQLGSDLLEFETDLSDTRWELDFQLRSIENRRNQNHWPLATDH